MQVLKDKILHFWHLFSTDMAFNKKMHGALTLFWFIAAFPIAIFLSQSIAFIVFISVYAVVGFHWNIWFTTKIEKKHEDHPVAEEILEELDKNTDVVVERKDEDDRSEDEGREDLPRVQAEQESSGKGRA